MSDELILKHFKKPSGYDVSQEVWEHDLGECLRFGCDWLEQFQKNNPLPAQAIEELCERCETLEKALAAKE